MNRIRADLFFKTLVSAASFVSILALSSILLFIFVQGLAPFVTPAGRGIRLVPQRIDTLTINGTVYQGESSIELPETAETFTIRFDPPPGRTLHLAVNRGEKDPARVLAISAPEAGISSPEAFVYTVSWPAPVAALAPRIHLLLPEPPAGLGAFITGLRWDPVRDKLYGILPMIAGTLLSSLLAALLGIPPAILSAVFMAEFLSPRAAAPVRAAIELLAGIPSVVFGFFGLMVIVPAVKSLFRLPSGNTLLSASIVLALMLLPTVITIAETSLRAVPAEIREASLALGASRVQSAFWAVLPQARPGIIAGSILGLSRALGETMAVILVAGNAPQLVKSPLESVRTLTATIAMEMGYASGRHSEMLFSAGVALFIMILLLNSLILAFRRRMGDLR